MTCKPVGADTAMVMPGWACCQCPTYNGSQRGTCKGCGHSRCDGVPAADLDQLKRERTQMGTTMTDEELASAVAEARERDRVPVDPLRPDFVNRAIQQISAADAQMQARFEREGTALKHGESAFGFALVGAHHVVHDELATKDDWMAIAEAAWERANALHAGHRCGRPS